MEDLARFGLAIVSVPIAVIISGIVIGLIGRWIVSRRGG